MAIGNALMEMYKEVQEDIGDGEDTSTAIIAKTSSPKKVTLKTVTFKCPECGESVNFEGGCMTCPNCGWTKCD